MLQNQLSFESENLVVDYISFKFQKLDNFPLKEIASYLFESCGIELSSERALKFVLRALNMLSRIYLPVDIIESK